jgi:hypothetical protein
MGLSCTWPLFRVDVHKDRLLIDEKITPLLHSQCSEGVFLLWVGLRSLKTHSVQCAHLLSIYLTQGQLVSKPSMSGTHH